MSCCTANSTCDESANFLVIDLAKASWWKVCTPRKCNDALLNVWSRGTDICPDTVIYRDVPGVRIPGGSEDVLMDLAVRELVKNFRRKIQLLEKQNASKL